MIQNRPLVAAVAFFALVAAVLAFVAAAFVVAAALVAGLVTFAFVFASGLDSVAAWRAEARVGAAAPFFAAVMSVAVSASGSFVFLIYFTPATVKETCQ